MGYYRLSDEDQATLQYHVTTKLREAILQGEFEHGEKLVQEQWAEKLGVSRMPIREALRKLETEGLIRLEPRKGAVVTPITIEDIEEIYGLRAILEAEATILSLPYITDGKIVRLKELCDSMSRLSDLTNDMKRYMELNNQFHLLIRENCPWRRINTMIDTLWKGISSNTPSLLKNHTKKANEEHHLIVKAIIEKDKELIKKTIEAHILRTRDNLMEYLKK